MRAFRLLTIGFYAGALLFCSSCAQLERTVASGKKQTDRLKIAIAGKPARGPKKIVVELDEQRAYFYRGKRVVHESPISTGRRGYETPVGRYRVIQKDVDHLSNLYGDYVDGRGRIVKANVDVRRDARPRGTRFRGAEMPYFLRFTGAYGMHAGYVPRHRASHGCIRMPHRNARRFFDTADIGTPVVVKH
jgi:lipoprotein-anchoring transpeptidase ErfK/SrfK